MARIVPCELPRRTLLAGGGVLLAAFLTGCSGPSPRQAAERAERSAGARLLREETEADSLRLLARYDSVADTHPELAERLAPLRRNVEAQLTALTRSSDASPDPGGAAEEAPAEGGGRDSEERVPPEVESEPDAALAGLARAESELAGRRLEAVAEAPPELARLLASLAAAGATQRYLLDGAVPEDDGFVLDGAMAQGEEET
ncbi:hypothetical protein [Streptomyces otsuchiensis]|uniref:hypothetical protein n=1 Tax=Streptomyces otsuchiensis TaxID=2681388 RepID=UPI001D1324A0|nr:hypothetical protein [Streptomyces otsuchiensis]